MMNADVIDYMKTLIRTGYSDESLSTHTSTASQTAKPNFSEWERIINQRNISRQWRPNVQGSTYHSKDTARKDFINSSYEATWLDEQQLKSKLSMIGYNVYNNMTLDQPFKNKRKIQRKVASLSKERGSLNNYFDQSTIHGLKYIGDTALPKTERIFWMISVVLALCGAAFFIWHLYFKFTTSPIIISRAPASVFIHQIPFPALTICNMNNAKKSFAEQIKRGKDEVQKFLLSDTCDENTKTLLKPDEVKTDELEKFFIGKFLLEASQNCTEMIYHCQWNGNDANCTDLFNPVYTDEGLCCNFNAVKQIVWNSRTWNGLNITYASDEHVDWNPEYVFKKSDPPTAIPWRAHGSGASHGLTLALDVDVDEYYCSSTASVGFKMLLHSPVETPQMREFGFTLSPGKETRVIITPHITDADSAIMKIAPKIRQCYFLNERRLRYYRTYTERNCQLECEANSTLKLCHCMQYYMPVEDGTPICDQTNDECVYRVKKMIYENFKDDDHDRYNDTFIKPGCNCYPGCYEIDYSTEISQSMLVATFEVGHKFLKNNPTYFEKNVAIVHVFYIDNSYIKYTKNELYGFAELLSNTGGLLGLFMGFSLLSVTEIMYYVLLWICRLLYETRKKKGFNRTLAKKQNLVYPFAQ